MKSRNITNRNINMVLFSTNPLKKSGAGFTLIEFLIVIGVLAIVVASAMPLTIDFYNSRQIDLYEQGLVQYLRKAQLKAMETHNDSSFGVYLDSEKYVLFQGGKYNKREESLDQKMELPDNLEISGINEIIFNKLSGEPSETGEIVLRIGGEKETVSINGVGIVNY